MPGYHVKAGTRPSQRERWQALTGQQFHGTPPTMKGQPMQTPDPWLTSEQFGALAVTVITNVIVLFGLDVSDARQAALIALVNTAYTVFVFVHAAVVRNGRARSLGVPYPERTPNV